MMSAAPASPTRVRLYSLADKGSKPIYEEGNFPENRDIQCKIVLIDC
jgi:hypothetical protein